MVQYYWNPNFQQAVPHPGMAQPVTPPVVTIPAGGRPPGPPQREESFIENILRLNIGNSGIFHFSFEHAIRTGINTLEIVGTVQAAGRDHVIIRETDTGKKYLIPMIYFDFAEFPGEMKYFNHIQ